MNRLLKKIMRAAAAAVLVITLCFTASDMSIEAAAAKQTGVMPAVNKNKIRVGVIYNGNPDSGNGYSFEHAAGIEKMRKKLGLRKDQIIERSDISEKDTSAINEAFRELIASGCNIIFATSYGYMSACNVFSDGYKTIVFSNCSGNKSNGKNFNNYFGRLYEARYLSGVVAGKNTKTDRLGFVAAKGLENSEVTESINAFAMGAYAVNPDCKVMVEVTGSWNDPQGETQATLDLVNSGCDVIAQHCDSSAPQYTAARAGVSSIGYNSDMSTVVPYSVLTSVVWDWSVYYIQAVRSLIDGTWSGKNYYGGLDDGVVGVAQYSSACTEGTGAAAVSYWQDMLDGKFKVFDGEIMTNSGKIIGKKGGTLSDKDIRDNMNWYFRNVYVMGKEKAEEAD